MAGSWTLSRLKMASRECATCGRNYTPHYRSPMALEERGPGKYCSVACRRAAPSTAIVERELECAACGEGFRPPHRSPNEIAERGPSKYCSRKCFYAAIELPEIKCPVCKKMFTPKHKYVNGEGELTVFCSSRCYGQTMELMSDTQCDCCRKPLRRIPGRRKNHFCSDLCRVRVTNRSGHSCWKGGRYKTERGWMLRVYGSDEDTCGRDILEHRYVVQQAWGYKLDSTEVVLHVNGDIYDNRLENLYVTKGLTEAGKIIHGSLPWPSAGNVLGGLPRQFADKWGPSQSTIRDKRNGGVDIRFRPYECHKDDV